MVHKSQKLWENGEEKEQDKLRRSFRRLRVYRGKRKWHHGKVGCEEAHTWWTSCWDCRLFYIVVLMDKLLHASIGQVFIEPKNSASNSVIFPFNLVHGTIGLKFM